MVVKVIGMAAGLGVSIFLGRAIGVEGLGIISLANRIVSLLMVLAMLGMDQVLVKHIAIGYERHDLQRVGNNIFTATVINGLIAFVISLTGIIFAPYFSNHVFNEPQLETPLTIAFIVMLPQTFSRVFGAGLIGFRKVWQSSLVNETLSMWIIGILLIVLYLFKVEINVVRVAIIYAIGRFFVTISVIAYWKKIFKFKGKRKWIARPMLKMAMPLLLVTSTSVISASADTIMLGWLSTTYNVGLYNVGSRIALLVSFFLMVTNAAVSPKLAALFADNKIKEMETMVKTVTFGLILIAIFSLTVFIVFGKTILGLWGSDFKEAYYILIILGIGQFFNISTGSSGLLLIMCGYEKLHGYISLTFVLMNLLLNYFLIKNYGAFGAAIATTITVSGENLAKLILAKKKTGVLAIPFKFKT